MRDRDRNERNTGVGNPGTPSRQDSQGNVRNQGQGGTSGKGDRPMGRDLETDFGGESDVDRPGMDPMGRTQGERDTTKRGAGNLGDEDPGRDRGGSDR